MDKVVRNRVLARVVVFVYADGMTATSIVPLSLSLARRRRVGRHLAPAIGRGRQPFVLQTRPNGSVVASPVGDAAGGAGLIMGFDPGTPDGDQSAVVYIRPDGTMVQPSEMTDAERRGRAHAEHQFEERKRARRWLGVDW